ncbi:MAG: phospho-N-acetylmuramoyl-pentapeptide-transferase [Verrucomicrobiales bacterium]|nr:phospho-N-acetylmuramoyl-pentapeptide-transferase [Verrucomicrobiales bacterium]
MFYYLHELKDNSTWLEFFNVFQYQTFRAAGAALTAFLVSVLLGGRVILKLTSLKLGQPIRTKDEVHRLAELHGGKTGTPTMGGILIVGAVLLSVVLWSRMTNPFIQTLIFVTITTGALGFADDYLKVTRKNSVGVRGKVKLLVQFLVSFIAIGYLYFNPETSEHIRKLFFPSIKYPVIEDMGILTFVLLPLVIVGCSNAVNLTDGLDGLAAGCTVTTASAYAIFAYLAGHQIAADHLHIPYHQYSGEVAVFCAALGGAGLGFLWFNCHPAKVFMGDTGSLAIGGMLGMIAICCKQELLLVVIGFVFVMEAMSVILQVASFKLTGKRIFKMSPIHHHFELLGWEESKVINRFWIISIIAAMIGLMTLKLR